MADDESRNEDAKKRPGKSSKRDDKTDKSAKSTVGKGDAKSGDSKKKKSGDAKSDKAETAKGDKAEKAEKTVKTRDKDDDDKGKDTKKSETKDKPRGPIGRLGLFLREIVEQLRKVVYPTRKQLLTYTTVVLVFVAIMIALISGFDWTFSKGVEWMFGGDSSSSGGQ